MCLVQYHRAACPLQSAASCTVSISASSLSEYWFLLLPQEKDRKWRFPSGSVFVKLSIQCHPPQDCREESSRI
ncbi:hypothetical protein TNCV_2227141 [Trichonephila clavipes]|uniref:Uncharacterized protein n=1 Tax=Trichonephila clavipes TaxID=2585209 RepID=A0A8X6WER0_TRICX|nr:hypothetical protein TNCV_2227141 [Trichonephila clavipes]